MFINNGVSNNPNQYEMCMRAENVVLPNTGYFGISGATGGLAGKFLTVSCLSIPFFLFLQMSMMVVTISLCMNV